LSSKKPLPVVYKDVKLDCDYILMNFHVRVLKDGVRRIVNEFPDSASSAISAVKRVS
jgi:hypothetical protein